MAKPLAAGLALGLFAGCYSGPPPVARRYRCEKTGGCTLTVNGAPAYYPYGVFVPVACGGVVLFACGGVAVGCGGAACGGASCGASCGGASCGGGGCGGGCGGCGG